VDTHGFTHTSGNNECAVAIDVSKTIFGTGALTETGSHAKHLGISKAVLITDSRIRELAFIETVVKSLRDQEISVAVFDDVEIEPTEKSLKSAITFASSDQFDGFISLGGGSVMDTAKAANLYSCYPPKHFLDYVNKPLGSALPAPGPLKPHIACPTTFGTASECTNVAIFNFNNLGTKAGISNRAIKPSLAIIDPTALRTLPGKIIAASGMDVFSHAVESYTARPYTERPQPEDPLSRPVIQGANPYSDVNCLEALRLISSCLPEAVSSPLDRDISEKLALAGLLAGIGFGTAGCHLPHGMSYAVSGLVRNYHGEGWPGDHPLVPHGYAVIVNSPSVFRHMGPSSPERHTRAAEALGVRVAANQEPGQVLADAVIALMQVASTPNGLSELGYTHEDLDALTDKGWKQRRVIDNAVRPITKDEMRAMFAGAFSYW